jgi:L-threonylcarbamoyladenylate synthase
LHVVEDFDGVIPCILKGPNAKHGLESTVIDCTTGIPHILRPGVVTLEDLRTFGNKVRYATRTGRIKSPGQKYKHYSPKARVKVITNYKLLITKDPEHEAFIGLDKNVRKTGLKKLLICRDLNEYAKNLFAFFRQCDNDRIKTIYCEKVELEGIGMAIMNRLLKA